MFDLTQHFGADFIKNVSYADQKIIFRSWRDLGEGNGKGMLSVCCVLHFFRKEIQERLLSPRKSSLLMEVVKVRSLI